MIRGLSSSGLPALLKTAPWGEPFRVSGADYLLCGPWEPPGPEGRGEGDGREGAAAGGEDGLLGALADGGVDGRMVFVGSGEVRRGGRRSG